LGQIARDEPAFRVFALTALSAMADFAAYEQLRNLLDSSSAETRYGAFRALWAMNSRDALVAGERLSDQFSYHVLDTTGPSLIHATHNRRPELVLFGKDQRLGTPLAVNAGTQIMVTSRGPDEIAVSKYAVEDADQKRVVSTRVDEVVRAIVELGGTYPDVVQLLQEAKAAGALPSRFEVDALPEAGRTYPRLAADSTEGSDASDEATATPSSPAPELFSKRGATKRTSEGDGEGDAEKKSSESPATGKKSRSLGGFFGRILGRSST
jgi:hypothetical protein